MGITKRADTAARAYIIFFDRSTLLALGGRRDDASSGEGAFGTICNSSRVGDMSPGGKRNECRVLTH